MVSGNGVLYLEVNAGLCNRIRALISGICWARKLDRELIICWPSFKPECVAGFYDLFAESSLPTDVHVIDDVLSQKTTCLSPMDAVHLLQDVPAGKPISLISHGCFWSLDKEMWLHHLRNLQPSQAVVALMASWNLKGLRMLDTVIHIRRTDNEKAIRLSPLSAFIQKIKNLPSEKKYALFTDDAVAAGILQGEFGSNRILTFESCRNRYSKEGMIEAAAVFFCLASKKIILGSANSSFSEIARDYGGGSLEIIS